MISIQGIKDPDPKGLDNIFWFIVDSDKNAIIVDPGKSKLIMDYMAKNDLNPDSIIVTHNCYDHVDGIADITAKFHCPVLGPENEGMESITQAFTEGDSFERMGVKFDLLSLPGHTQDHIGFIANGEHFFCGDVIFGAGCGTVPEGSHDMMFDSLQKCAKLPATTKLYWGHEYTATNLLFATKVEPSNQYLVKRLNHTQKDIEKHDFSAPGVLQEELDTNPFLRVDQSEVITSAEKYAGDKLGTPAEVFATLRRWKTSA